MKKLMILGLLAALPAAAQAMGMDCVHDGMMHKAMMRGPHPLGLHLAAMLYALMAALGYWVLRHAAADTVKSVRVAGKTVAWFLLVFGLLGMLCGLGSHIKKYSCCGKQCDMEMAGSADKADHAMPAEKPMPGKK